MPSYFCIDAPSSTRFVSAYNELLRCLKLRGGCLETPYKTRNDAVTQSDLNAMRSAMYTMGHIQFIDMAAVLDEISQFFIGLESIGDHDPCCNETATRNACKTELLRLGRITHMLQDFFAHGIVEEKSDSFWHPEGRLPENANPFMPFSVIPSSYSIDERPFMLFFDNYYLGNEEHGGLLNREPGNRAVDHDLRKERSIQWTKFFLESMLPLWSEKCQKCVNKIIPPPPPRHDHGSISHGR